MTDVDVKDGGTKKPALEIKNGSTTGLIITVLIGFVLYFILGSVQHVGQWFPYDQVAANAETNLFYKGIWFLMNFSEPQFYAGVLASIGMIFGGFVAWRLSVRRSKYAGFDVCYGSNLWPWVFASQILSLGLAIFVLDYNSMFNGGEYTWIPTFISVVGAPPSIMLLYGPNYRALLTGSILGGLICAPTAFWIMTRIIPLLGIPGVVGNVLTMAITGIIICQVCHILPCLERVPSKTIEKDTPELSREEELERMLKPTWFVRRVLADFSEPQFYGNEIAGLFIILGACLEWFLNSGHGAYASGTIPAIILSQFIAGGVGVYLYTHKFFEKGWYATYVPVVSVGPACVLMFGATIPVALFAGILGGIIGAPVAEFFGNRLPDHIHGTNANVLSMALSTTIVAIVMQALPWF